MTSLYEKWTPSVGDRVRIVERNEQGAATESGLTGTVVAVHRDHPEGLCDVQYDPESALRPDSMQQTHAAVELVLINRAEPTPPGGLRQRGGEYAPMERELVGVSAGDAWQPTVGDRVEIRADGRGATITAIDERPEGTICEVEYDHQPGQSAEPSRASHAVTSLTPTREPSAAVVDGGTIHRAQ